MTDCLIVSLQVQDLAQLLSRAWSRDPRDRPDADWVSALCELASVWSHMRQRVRVCGAEGREELGKGKARASARERLRAREGSGRGKWADMPGGGADG